jgi:tetratricopeptide (TPR) repeat protein
VSVVDGPLPATGAVIPTEAREVLADTRARIAELLSRSKQFEAAVRHVDLALELVPESNYYRGHLFETRGVIEQRRADALKAEGNIVAADAAKAAALTAFETAMQIQAEVIRQTPVPGGEPTLPSPSGTTAPHPQGTQH